MILISAGLVLTAVVLLIAGVVIAKPFLVMWSIAVSVLSAVFLVIGALLRRHELFPGGGRAGVAPPSPFKGPAPAGPMPVPPMASHRQPVPGTSAGPPEAGPQGARRTAAAVTRPRPAPAAGPAARQGVPDAEAIVLVIPGRRRYHIAGCRQLAGREHEELTHEEAREEGFTPCTTCLPEFSGGIAPQDAPEEQDAAPTPLPLPSSPTSRAAQSFQESGSSGAAGADSGEADSGETVRFTPPYRPVGAAGTPVPRPHTPPRQSEDPLRESPEQPVPAPSSASSPASSAVPPGGSAVPFAAPSFPRQTPPPASAAEDASATSWFSREPVSPPAAAPEPEERAETESPAESSAESPEPASAAPAEASEPMETAVKAAAEPSSAGSETDESETDRSETDESETDRPEPESDGRPGAEPAPARSETAAESVATGPVVAVGTAEPAEPGEPAGTEQPGRAGRPVSTGSTADEPEDEPGEPTAAVPEEDDTRDDAPDTPQDDDTSPHGIPAVKTGDDGSDTVTVISGTRRFHGEACPLVRGVDDEGLETMSRAEAEKAGLSGCAVCQGDLPDRG
ncbi:hypothetical protein [Planomonospora sp. ID82291]|uniref:hypothetical protein n=1 Tax=Planomonospora sp. ID82291 TaxID=2738136 RepID=UPI0018C40E23|nr:hypothetical protein [Planomonospora sp. ID82291]MBG0817395.1 hypothetical protein [Planomonospora sp. ID82291]